MTNKKFESFELEAQNERIMEQFNFEKVHAHMVEKSHTWYLGNGINAVPDIEELRVTARSLLTKAAYDRNEVANCGTGGFMAYKMPWGMSLVFQLAWS